MLSSPGSNSPVIKVRSKRPVLISQRQGVTLKKNFIFRKHRWKLLYCVSYSIAPFSSLCVSTGVDCTCFVGINSVQNSCIVILELKNQSTCMLHYVMICSEYSTAFKYILTELYILLWITCGTEKTKRYFSRTQIEIIRTVQLYGLLKFRILNLGA